MVRSMQTTTRAYTYAGDILMTGLFNRLQDEIEARESGIGLSPIDLLDMPDTLADVIHRIIRNNGMKLEDIATELNQSPQDTAATLEQLVAKGYARRVTVKNEVWYKAQFGRKADKVLSLNIWSSLNNIADDK